jgi:hypothetical protein
MADCFGNIINTAGFLHIILQESLKNELFHFINISLDPWFRKNYYGLMTEEKEWERRGLCKKT